MTKTTDIDKIKIVEMYKNGLCCNEIGRKFNITGGAVSGLLKRRGIEIRINNKTNLKYPIDTSFFDKIDTRKEIISTYF